MAGACLAIGLRYAGTADARAKELLAERCKYFLKHKAKAPDVSAGAAATSGNIDKQVIAGILDEILSLRWIFLAAPKATEPLLLLLLFLLLMVMLLMVMLNMKMTTMLMLVMMRSMRRMRTMTIIMIDDNDDDDDDDYYDR